MDDKRTPMEAEVQELPNRRESICPEDSYGTAARQKPRRNYVGLWICMGLAVIAVCSVCVAAAVKRVHLENGENGWRLAVQSTEVTEVTEETVRNLDIPAQDPALEPVEPISNELHLPVAGTSGTAKDPTEIYDSIRSAVVCVEVTDYYGSETYTGVVITEDGCILSATDGLGSGVTIYVVFPDGTALSAKRLGEDPVSGVCLLKVEAEGLQTVLFSAEEAPKVGQSVYSVCNPYGSQLPNVFNDGMLSACQFVELQGCTYRLLQSNSLRNGTEYGCPILNEEGLVLGITTPIGKQLISGEDPCFALSAENLARLIANFERTASGSSVWLGLEVADIQEEYHDFYRFPGSVWIERVSAGSASEGILYPYDIILAVDGIEISTSAEYETILASHQAGDRVLLTIYRNGRITYYLLPVVTR